MNKILAFVLSLLSLLIAGYFVLAFQGLGFPDGHLTEYEGAVEKLYPFLIIIYVLFAGYFFFLGYNKGQEPVYAKPRWAIFFFVVVPILIVCINKYLLLNLENGGGG